MGKGGKGKGISWQAKETGSGKGKGKSGGKKGGKASGKGKEEQQWVKVKGRVCVTGASGFIAMSCIRRLVDRGYKVRGTVRSLGNEATVGPLKKLFPSLELVEADLLGGPAAYEKAVEGCKYVLHTASPFQLAVGDPQKDLVDPALKGTESVVGACIKAGVQRVVVTSSVAAIGPPQSWREDPSKADKSKVFTEADWNTESTLEKGPYLLSKRLAEEKAWEMVKDTNTQLACINPSFVIGPMMTPRADGESCKFIKALLEGTASMAVPPLGVVDVRDVSLAHISAMEDEAASGKRFLCSSDQAYTRLELANMIRNGFKAYPIPSDGTTEPDFRAKFSHAQAKDVLKFKPRPVEISMRDMANAAIRTGMVEKKYVLKPVKFGKVADLMPDSRGVNLLVKVVSNEDAPELKDGTKRREILTGDASGSVKLSLVGEELDVVEEGKIIEVRNAQVRMLGGFMRITVGKWGKVAKHEGDTSITVNASKDMSSTEYELVQT